MFTGIILGRGVIERIDAHGNEMRLSIAAQCALPNIVVGESIAVNGACLTVESGADARFTAYASRETMSLTNLGLLRTGSVVNLERALAIGDRLGGHIVSGHVDGIATVETIADSGESRRIRLHCDPSHASEIIPKGSVTLDGISLTVNDCGSDFLEVNVIPETWRVTTIAAWRSGSSVNLETDVIGKYVRQMLSPYAGTGNAGKSSVTLDLLRENGFIS